MTDHPTLNRSALLVIPQQPFYEWSNAQFPDLNPTNEEDVTDHNTYLLEDELFLDNPKKELKTYWKKIFLNELYGHCTDPGTYPPLTWKRFTECFRVYRSSMIWDLTDEPLFLEQYD